MIKRVLWALPSIALLLLGLFASVDLLARIPLPTYTPIVFNSGVCFVFAAIALFCCTFPFRFSQLLQVISGAIILLITIFSINQNLFGLDLGIDQTHLARMTTNTAIGFLLVGLVFVLFPFARKKWIAFLVEIQILLLLLMGVLSLTGYFLNMEFVYSWYIYSKISLHTAIGFTILGITLWMLWRKSIYSYELYRGKEDQKITLLSGVILLSIGLIIGLTCFVSLSNAQLEMTRVAYQQLAQTHEKIDTVQFYMPMIRNLDLVLPVIFVAVLLGLLLLRLEVLPLIRRVVNAEKQLLRSNRLLKSSEERYALAVSGSNSGLWDWEVGTENIFYSPYFKKLLGYSEAEIPDNIYTLEKYLHPDDLKKVQNALRDHIVHHKPCAFECRVRCKSGEYRWLQAVGQARWDKQGRATRMAGSMTDVTERKISEQRLRTQYAVTQILSEANNLEEVVPHLVEAICTGLHWDYGAIWMADYQEDSLSCIGLWCNKDVSADEFLATAHNVQFHPGEGVLGGVWLNAQPYWIKDVATDPKFLFRGDAAKQAGLHSAFCFPILLQNNVFGVMEFFSREIETPDEKLLQMMSAIGPQIGQFIQRKNAENALRASEAHKTAILHSASDSIITMNEDGNIVSFNLQAEKMFGYNENEIPGKNLDELIPGLTSTIHHLIGKPPIEFVGINKHHGNFPVELAISVMEMQEQKLFVILVRDIRERKKVEKLKNEFISVVSHELRTPLTSIRGSLGLIQGGIVGQFSEKARKLLDIASSNCERLLRLINDILDIEKIEAGKMSFQFAPINIDKVIKESISINQIYGEKVGVKVVLIESINDALVNVDEDRLLQVMANLISNAVKFSPQGGVVKVAVRLVNKRVRVLVTDSGSGMSTDFQKRIFQKFSQADTTAARGKGGTGLGLSISKAIIERLGGTINFTTSPDVGTTFYFDLPVYQEIASIEKSPHVAGEQKSLLICEDDEDQANYLAAMLEANGYHVDIAMTVHDARELLAQNEYHALLLDLILPDQDGIAFIRELRGIEKTHELPIIVLSVIAQTGRALLNGDAFAVLDWLDKPIDFSKLLSDVQSIKKSHHVQSMRILHVEDETEARDVVKALLMGVADVVSVTTLQEALAALTQGQFDLVILDLILPDGKGTELLPLLAKSNTPVLVLSAVELDHEHAQFVREAMVKSETSPEHLLEMIKKIIFVED